MVSPAALLGAAPAFIPAPDWLRARTLEQAQLPASPAGDPIDGQGGSAATQSDREPVGQAGEIGAPRRGGRRAVIGAAVVVAIIVAGLGLGAAWMLERKPNITPADLTHKVTSSSAPIPQSPNVIENSPAVTSVPPSSIEGTVTSAPTAQTNLSSPPPTQAVPIQTSPVTTIATVSPSQVFPVRPPPTIVSEPPTFTAPPSQNPPSQNPPSTAPPTATATVVKPSRPITRPPGTVFKPIPVTTTPPVLQ